MPAATNVLVRFHGDVGEPDKGWLSTHEHHCRREGYLMAADSLRWMIDTFDRIIPEESIHTVTDSEGFLANGVHITRYREFEFAVALEWARCFRIDSRSTHFDDTYESVAACEISSCMGNFLCQTQYAEELNHLDGVGRWTLTTPDSPEMSEMIDAYTSFFRDNFSRWHGLPLHKSLQEHQKALAELINATDDEFQRAAGIVHAVHVLQHIRR